MIPTVGRIVHFSPLRAGHSPLTLAAIVTCVKDDNHVNLAVFDLDGTTYGLRGIPFSEWPPPEGHWSWPPRVP